MAANNTPLNPMAGGNTMATTDIAAFGAQGWTNSGQLTCGALYVSIDGIVTPTAVSKTNPLPVISSAASPLIERIEDGIGTQLLTVGLFHSADNQVLPGAGGAALTAGVAQIVNAGPAAFCGQNADRQRGTTSDGINNIGVATGAQQFAIPINTVGPITSGAITASPTTTVASASNGANITAGTLNVVSTTGFGATGTIAVQTTGGVALVAYTGTTATTFTGCTVTSGSGTVATANSVAQTRALTLTNASGTLGNGQAWAVAIGQALILDTNNASQEAVTVLAIAGAVVTVCPSKAHNASATAAVFVYNQARDAGQGDKVPLQGMSPSMTYLYNATAVTANQAELERSAAGELDGATGTGTNIAAEYEWNANVLANGSVFSGNQFDRASNLSAMGLGSGTITNNPLAANSTTLTLTGAPTTLNIGQQILLDRAGANPETNYVGSTYTPGSTTVPLQIATQFSHALNSTVEWRQHAPLGPGVSGFLVHGIGIEEEALYDPVSLKYYIERSATQDNADVQNVVMESEALFTGFGSAGRGIERARSVLGKQLVGTANFTNKAQNAGNITLTAPGAAGQTSLTFSADPSVATLNGQNTPLKAGMALYLCQTPATPTQVEIVYVAATYTGGTSVPLTAATQISHTATTDAAWESFGPTGPALTGFLASGMDLDEDAVFDPLTGLYFLERAATQDAVAVQNLVMFSPATFNETNGDRLRGNTDVVLLASASRTTTQTSSDQINYNGRAIDIVVDVTNIGTGNITMTINYKDGASGKYILLLAGAAISSNSTNRYRIHPNLTAAANSIAQDQLPRIFQIVVTANNANPVVYSVGYRILN